MKKDLSYGIPLLLVVTATLTAIFFSNCEKESAPFVAGRVLEFGTDKPIANAKVYLLRYDAPPLGSAASSIIDSSLSGMDGTYRFEDTPSGAVLRTQSTMPSYFPNDWSNDGNVEGNHDDNVDLRLYPHAWIEVTIRNDSGAYGFYPEREKSWLPPIKLLKGEEMILNDVLDLRRGNAIIKYLFSPILEEGGGTPPITYWSMVSAFVENQKIPIKVGVGASIEFYLPGHDTTNITIIY